VIADQGTGVADAFTYLNDLYQISKKNSWPLNDSDALAPFSEGKIAAVTNGNWAMGDYSKALGDKLGIAPLPEGPAGPAAPMLGVDGFYFNPNSTNQEAALEVALYLTNKESQTVMMNEAGHVPVRTDVEITDPLIQGLVDAFNKGATVRPQVPELGKYWSNFCGPDQIYEKGVAPADFVKTAVEAANK
jgi:arabinogalactan oligomer/maltooligosaccharide transport system substrate-binding protein